MFNATIIVVRHSGYMVLAFHWQYYVDISIAIFFTDYFILSMTNNYTIPYHTIPYHTIPYHTIPYQNVLKEAKN